MGMPGKRVCVGMKEGVLDRRRAFGKEGGRAKVGWVWQE
jgi:hypothetical protein